MNTKEILIKAFEQGYEKGHLDNVEGGHYCPEESAEDWIDDFLKEWVTDLKKAIKMGYHNEQ